MNTSTSLDMFEAASKQGATTASGGLQHLDRVPLGLGQQLQDAQQRHRGAINTSTAFPWGWVNNSKTRNNGIGGPSTPRRAGAGCNGIGGPSTPRLRAVSIHPVAAVAQQRHRGAFNTSTLAARPKIASQSNNGIEGPSTPRPVGSAAW
jgi:hypothetical protein